MKAVTAVLWVLVVAVTGAMGFVGFKIWALLSKMLVAYNNVNGMLVFIGGFGLIGLLLTLPYPLISMVNSKTK